MQISVHESVTMAMNFSLGTIVSEIIYVRLCLVGVTWLRRQKKTFQMAGMDNICVGYSPRYWKFYCSFQNSSGSKRNPG